MLKAGCEVTPLSTEDRLAIQDLFIGFAYAADALGDGEAIAAFFTDAAAYDLSAIGMQAYAGRAEIAEFFRGSFAATERNVHFVGNIKVHSADAAGAVASAFVHAFSHLKDGNKIDVRARYDVDLRRADDGWKFSRMQLAILPV